MKEREKEKIVIKKLRSIQQTLTVLLKIPLLIVYLFLKNRIKQHFLQSLRTASKKYIFILLIELQSLRNYRGGRTL